MRDYIHTTTEVPDRRQELASQLEASADRIREYESRLDADIGTLSASQYCQLLAEYYTECQRYNQRFRELEALEAPKKAENKEKRRKLNRERREKINY